MRTKKPQKTKNIKQMPTRGPDHYKGPGPEDFGDWTHESSDVWSRRNRTAVLREDPSWTWKITNHK